MELLARPDETDPDHSRGIPNLRNEVRTFCTTTPRLPEPPKLANADLAGKLRTNY